MSTHLDDQSIVPQIDKIESRRALLRGLGRGGIATAVFAMGVTLDSSASADNLHVIEYTQTGTVVSDIGGIPGTGGSFAVRSVSIFQLQGNRLAREAAYFDLNTLLTQIGAP